MWKTAKLIIAVFRGVGHTAKLRQHGNYHFSRSVCFLYSSIPWEAKAFME
jgi:hypothetical protein